MASKVERTSEVADKHFDGEGKEGSYKEYTGGGHPFEKGNTTTRTTRENGKIRDAENDTEQPRTDDGKFTYNAVNGKDVKYEHRGKTVPPTLTGGKNGVFIEDRIKNKDGSIDAKYDGKTASDFYADKDYVPFKAGDKVYFDGKVKTLTVGQFEIAQGYYEGAKDRREGFEEDNRETVEIEFTDDMFSTDGIDARTDLNAAQKEKLIAERNTLKEKYNGRKITITKKKYEKLAANVDADMNKFIQLFSENARGKGKGRMSKAEKQGLEEYKKSGSKDIVRTGEKDEKYLEAKKNEAEAAEKVKEDRKAEIAKEKEAKEVKKEYKEKSKEFSDKEINEFKEGYAGFLVESEGIKEEEARDRVNNLSPDELQKLMETSFEEDVKPGDENLGKDSKEIMRDLGLID